MYNRGGTGQTDGGLDRYLGPQAKDYSNLPPAIEEGKPALEEPAAEIDCDGKDIDKAVCEIAKLEQEQQREMPNNAT